jgi:hypothetical protein
MTTESFDVQLTRMRNMAAPYRLMPKDRAALAALLERYERLRKAVAQLEYAESLYGAKAPAHHDPDTVWQEAWDMVAAALADCPPLEE